MQIIVKFVMKIISAMKSNALKINIAENLKNNFNQRNRRRYNLDNLFR